MSNFNFETLIVEQYENYALLRLNRPDSYNSFNSLMHKELKLALKNIKENNNRALLITGIGKGFCVGQDLKERAHNKATNNSERPDLGESLEQNYNPLIKTLVHFPCPVVCAVNGVAAGAGVSLALACDLVVASDQAEFIQAFSKIGLIPDSGATWILPRLIGHARAAGLMILADKITAEEAQKWGLIWQVIEDQKLEERALELTKRLSTMPTQAIKHIKNALLFGWNNSLNEQLNLERDVQGVLGRTDDFQEGVSAFLEKRPPVFKGA